MRSERRSDPRSTASRSGGPWSPSTTRPASRTSSAACTTPGVDAGLHRRLGGADRRRWAPGHPGRGAHRLPRVPRRPGQDAAPEGARRHPRRPPPRLPRAAARRARRRAVRPGRLQPLPVPQTVASGATPDECVEQIDIGGPSMVRAAAKNHPSVAIVTSPDRYADVLARGRRGRLHPRAAAAAGRRGVRAHRVVRRRGGVVDGQRAHRHHATATGFPAWIGATWDRAAVLRYGENPHQPAALYADWRAAAWPQPSSCTARRCPTTTTSTPTRPAGRPTTSTSRRSRSSSTPTRAASRSAPTSPRRTARRTPATRCRRSAA